MIEEPLFEVSGLPPKMAAPPRKPIYARYHNPGRGLCADCCQDVITRGMAVAPPPMRARWRRYDNGKVTYLCELHKIERINRGDC